MSIEQLSIGSFMKKILLTLVVLCMCVSVHSEEWQRKGAIYINSSTLIKTGTNVQAWIIRPNFDKSRVFNPKYTYDMAYVDARCNAQQMAFLNTKWYNNRHELIEGISTGEMPTSYFDIKPKTNNEVIFNALCPKTGRRQG